MELADSKGSGPVTFVADGVSSSDLQKYEAAVANNGSTVAKGIVAQLTKQGKKATASQSGTKWTITVGQVSLAEGGNEASFDAQSAEVQVFAVNATINFQASSADVPAIINALNGFFSNWNAVAGLIATGAAFAAAYYVLKVRRH